MFLVLPVFKLSTGLGFCSKTGTDTFRSFLLNGKEQEPQKKHSIVVQKISSSSKSLTVRTRAFF